MEKVIDILLGPAGITPGDDGLLSMNGPALDAIFNDLQQRILSPFNSDAFDRLLAVKEKLNKIIANTIVGTYAVEQNDAITMFMEQLNEINALWSLFQNVA